MSENVGFDAALVAAAMAGDQRAVDELVAACLPLAYNIVGRSMGGHPDVDDVVQETMLQAVRGLPGLRSGRCAGPDPATGDGAGTADAGAVGRGPGDRASATGIAGLRAAGPAGPGLGWPAFDVVA
jgi:hypothetical protein